jgi:prephenate dehydrogenase
MTVQLTIIGLGQIGASVGLALAGNKDKVTRFGHDLEPYIAKRAQEMGAVDKVFFNLPAAVENANIVLLALPIDQIRDTLQVIGPCLQENAVVMDTSLGKNAVAEWAKEFLPPHRHYVGLTPAINPFYLQETEKDLHSAHADLFTKGLMAIVAPQGTVGAAIKLAADLSSLLGAVPYFIDQTEADSMMTSLHVLPQLTAAAIANVNMDRPGWDDARKLAGRAYFAATALVDYDGTNALVETVFQNRENVIQVLNELITSLEELRDDVADQERDSLADWLEQARQGRSKWWLERSAGDWKSLELNKMGLSKDKRGIWKRLFGDFGKLFGPPKFDSEEKKK